jgi:hypothetical protein
LAGHWGKKDYGHCQELEPVSVTGIASCRPARVYALIYIFRRFMGFPPVHG